MESLLEGADEAAVEFFQVPVDDHVPCKPNHGDDEEQEVGR